MEAGNLVVRLTNDVTQIQNSIMMTFQMLIRVPLMFIGALYLSIKSLPELWWTLVLYIVIALQRLY